MTDFERGIRFATELTQTFTLGSGPEVTQFGDYQMTMVEREITKWSHEHRERIIQAMLSLADQMHPWHVLDTETNEVKRA